MEQEPKIPAMLEARIFSLILRTCQDAITFSGNHPAMRNNINNLLQELRRQSKASNGHDALEAIALVGLLRRTAPAQSSGKQKGTPPRSVDPIEVLLGRGLIHPSHADAAANIREVWAAFSKFLAAAGRDYRKGGGGSRGRALAPLDVMGVDLLNHWRFEYIPWFEKAKAPVIDKNGARGRGITRGSLVLHVINDMMHPDLIDRSFRLAKGTALTVLKEELTAYDNPASARAAAPRQIHVLDGDGPDRTTRKLSI